MKNSGLSCKERSSLSGRGTEDLAANAVFTELAELAEKECCRAPFLSGFIRGAATLNFTREGFSVTFRHKNKALIEKAFKYLTAIVGAGESVLERTVTKSGLESGEFFTLIIPPKTASTLLSACKIVEAKTEILGVIPRDLIEKRCCKRAYLRGLILSCGHLRLPTNPLEEGGKKGGAYELTLSLNSAVVLEDIKSLIAHEAKIQEKGIAVRSESALHIKNAEAVCALLTAAGSRLGVLKIHEVIASRKIKSDVNRRTNFELANITKTVEAGGLQVLAVQYINENGLLSTLPKALQETAEIRYNNPEATLNELVKLHGDNVTKSGVNHRLRKLIEIYQSLDINKDISAR